MQSPVKLSICIPTYNRSRFLDRLLGLFLNEYRFDCAYEIVVSDDCSPDNTAELTQSYIDRGLPITYHRCSVNLGYEKNLLSALHLARGELIIYLGDDDKLIHESVNEVVAFMDANPSTTVCYTPAVLHNEISGGDYSQTFQIERDYAFGHGDFDSALKFILRHHVFPETGIYRADALRSVWVSRHFCYWAFAYMAHFLDQGSIAFRQKPFYRAITGSAIDRDRPPAGEEEVMKAWDRYRGGLEYMLFYGLKRGAIAADAQTRRSYREWIDDFTAQRMIVAARFWIQANDHIRAYELLARVISMGFEGHPEVAQHRQVVPAMAAVQTLGYVANSIAGITDVVIHGFPNFQHLKDNLRKLGLKTEITVRTIEEVADGEDLTHMVVLFLQEENRPLFLSAGFHAGLLFSEADLLRTAVI